MFKNKSEAWRNRKIREKKEIYCASDARLEGDKE